nr:uncharacterized protein LOC109744029 [Aegilops tauschii subsp. strangulata]
MLCTATISNVVVTKTLINGGASLNVLSVETFDMLQVPYDQLMPTRPFYGVTDSSTTLMGQVRLPVTFGNLPYNAILGYPALAKFMVTVHHGDNVLKMLGCSGVITVTCNKQDAFFSLEQAENSGDEGGVLPQDTTLAKKKQLLPMTHPKITKPAGDTSGPTPVVGTPLPPA